MRTRTWNVAEAKKLYETADADVDTLAARYGVSHSTMHAALKSVGTRMRKPGRRARKSEPTPEPEDSTDATRPHTV